MPIPDSEKQAFIQAFTEGCKLASIGMDGHFKSENKEEWEQIHRRVIDILDKLQELAKRAKE